ncbi:MAG TPA: PAS domain S-box protein, partial [Nitrospira sp.]|nr:PAS domain S-box protein [Nitrospira sp.]
MARKAVFSYLISTAALLAAVLLRWLLDPWLGDHLPFPVLYGAVALAVWVGGYGPAVAIAVVGYLACNWLFQSPRGSVAFEHMRDLIGLGIYLASCAIIIGFGEAARSARRVADRRAGQLEYEARLRTKVQETAREEVLGVNRQLRERVEELQTLMDIFPGGILIADPECRRITANRAFYQMLGLPLGTNVSLRSKLTDMPAGTRIFRDDRELAADEYPMQTAGRTGRVVLNFDHDVVFPDGRTVTLLANTAPLLHGDGEVRGVLGAYTDITERKRAEEALRDSEANFRAMFSASSVGMAQTDSMNGRFLRVNAAMSCLTGYTEAELLDRSIYAITHPDDHPRSREEMRRVNSGEIDTYRLDKRYLRKDGREVWVHVTVNVIRDKQGRAWRNAAVIQDITERKQAEESLKEADRRKDMFLAMLAHELRNPLAPIRNAVQIMKVKQLPEREFTSSRDIVERQVALMARLLDDLLDVSRITRNRLELRRKPVSLVSVLQSAVETSRPLIEAAGHELRLELPEETFYLDADPVRLAQVFANLLNNAAKYTPNGGRIRIKAERRGPALAVSVEDDGMGIAPLMLPRLFDLFSQAPPALAHS